MSQAPAMFRPLVRYVDFQGRSNRAEFWWYTLFIYVVTWGATAFFLVPAFAGGHFNFAAYMGGAMRFGPLVNLFSLAVLLPTLAVGVRRLHDTDRTGWWVILPAVLMIASVIAFFVVHGSDMGQMVLAMRDQIPADPTPADTLRLEAPMMQLMMPWMLISGLLCNVPYWILCAMPGTPVENRFGHPVPKG